MTDNDTQKRCMEAHNLMEQLKKSFWRQGQCNIHLAKLLSEIDDNKDYQAYNCLSLEELLEQLGFDAKKGSYLKHTYRKMNRTFGISPETILRLGFPKAELIAKNCTTAQTAQECASETVKNSLSYSKLERLIASKEHGSESERFTCTFSVETSLHVRSALDLAKGLISKESGRNPNEIGDGEALDVLASEFHSSAICEVGKKNWLSWHLDNLARVFRVCISVSEEN